MEIHRCQRSTRREGGGMSPHLFCVHGVFCAKGDTSCAPGESSSARSTCGFLVACVGSRLCDLLED